MRRQARYSLRCPVRSAIGGHRYGSYKTITLAIPRLNETLRLPVVADGAADGLETVFNRRIAGSLRRPHLFAELLLRHDTVTVGRTGLASATAPTGPLGVTPGAGVMSRRQQRDSLPTLTLASPPGAHPAAWSIALAVASTSGSFDAMRLSSSAAAADLHMRLL